MKKYFTLIELIVVIVANSILAAIVIPNISDIRERATISALDSDARNIETAVDMYVLNKQSYPTKDGTAVNPKQPSITGELFEEITVEGNNLLAEKVMVNELIQEDFLRKFPKNKKAVFYLIEGGDVIWTLEGIISADDRSPSEKTDDSSIEEGDTSDNVNIEPTMDFEFEEKSDHIIITKYIGTSLEVVIPSEINNKPVTILAENSISKKEITSVIIPNSVTSIGKNAFEGNALTEVILPDSITSIGEYAFNANRLTNLVIPKSITSIKASSFQNNKLIKVTIPNSVTSIERDAFYNNNLTSITIPNSVKTIGISAFEQNKLKSLIIPNSVTEVDMYAFYKNDLTSVTLSNSITKIHAYSFSDNNLTTVSIPNSVTSIRNNAFEKNKLTNVTLSNSLVEIRDSSFRDNKLTKLAIPNSVKSIGGNAFRNNQLTEIVIPKSINSYSSYTFWDNPNLSKVYNCSIVSETNIRNLFNSKPAYYNYCP